MISQPIYIEVDDYLYERITSVQYDNGTRFLDIHLLSNGQAIDLTGTRVIISGEKPDGEEIFNSTTMKDALGGNVLVELTEQMNAIPGDVKCQLEIYGAEGQLLTTKTFNIEVTKRAGSKTVTSSSEFGALKKALEEVQDIDNRFAQTNAQLSAVKEHCTGGNGMQDHSHVNKTTVDKLSESSDGKLMFNNNILGAEFEKELSDLRNDNNGNTYESAGEAVRQQIKTVMDDMTAELNMNGLGAGSYTDACKKALDNNTPFQFLLKTEDFTKPIFHLGNCVFVDAVGAEVEDELDEKLIYNFTYKVKLTVDNEIVYVPVDSAYKYNMYVDWGDGSEDTYFTGTGTLKSCSHQYTGKTGSVFTIVLYGSQIPHLNFGVLSRGGQQTLLSVENNTLKNEILLNFNNCSNLERVAKNTLRNYTGTSIDFAGCTSLTLIEDGFSTYINKSNIASVSFSGTKISKIDDDLFEGINLTSAGSLFRATKLSKVPSSLSGALVNCSDFYYTFYGVETSLKIPDGLFDNVKVAINDVRNCFNGGSAVSLAPLTGDAKRLYDALSSKMTGTNYASCFANNTLSNRDQVPTSWGGTLK